MKVESDVGPRRLIYRVSRTVVTGICIALCLWIVTVSTWNPELWVRWWGLGIAAGAITTVFIIARWTNWTRGLTQFGVFLSAEVFYLCSGSLCGLCPLSFGACPAGTVQRLAFMPEFPWYWTLAAVLATGVVLGSLVCGWLCPVGFVQDLVNSLNLKQTTLPKNIHLVRWVMLAGAIVLIPVEIHWQLMTRWGLFVFSEPTFILFAVVVVLALVVARPFCKALCPFGLLYGRLNRVSPIKVRLPTSGCRECGKCDSACVSGIHPLRDVNGELCSKCFDCSITRRKQKCADGKD